MLSSYLKERKYFARDHLPQPFEVTRSNGSYLFDEDGKKHIDFLGGWCVGNFGWSNKALARSIKTSKAPSYVYPGYVYKPWGELAALLASIAPGKLKKTFRATGGTESVEAAMQIAMCYTGRSKFMSIEGSYHGNSIATLSIGSSDNKEKFRNLLPGCYKAEPPLDIKAAQKIETRLKQKDIAAFIMEPVICNLGVMIPDRAFMLRLQDICHKHGTLLVMDEVATGFGRTGKLFATEHFGISPDIMCMAKAITGGHAPLGATITTEKIANAVQGKVSLYSTYGWHPLSTDVAIANVKYIISNKKRLLNNAVQLEAVFRKRLSAMKFKTKPKLNILGCAVGVDVGNSAYALLIQQRCQKKGLLFNAEDASLIMFPALTIEKEVAEEGLNILEECI
jgi:acetylornithine/succinyldiaminopimelate/putrescine aminotransferase